MTSRRGRYFEDEVLADAFVAIDWRRTDVGEPEYWPQSLKTVVRMMGTSRRAMAVVVGEELRLLYNVGFGQMLGCAHPEALGRPLKEVFAQVEPALNEVRQQGAADVEWRLSFDGKDQEAPVRRIRGHGVCLCVADEVVGLMVTDVRVDETALSIDAYRRLRVFETVLSSTEDFVYLLDRSARFIYANEAICKLWGRELSEVVGMSFEDLGYPQELVELHEHQVGHVIATGKPIRAANPYTDHRGETRYYEYVFTPVFNGRGRVESVAGITRDVTELKEAMEALRRSEERYRTLFEQVDEGVCILEVVYDEERPVDTLCVAANPALEEQLGLKNPRGKTLRELFTGEDRDWTEIAHQVATTGKSIRFEESFGALDGWFDVYVFPMEYGEQRRLGVMFSNTTERKHKEMRAELLNKIGEDFSRLSEPRALQKAVADHLANLLGVSRVTFSEIDETGEVTRNVYDWHEPGLRDATGEYRLAAYMGKQNVEKLQAGHPVVMDDISKELEKTELVEGYRSFGIEAAVHIPYHSDEKWKFVMAVFHGKRHRWREDEIDLLCDVAERLWLRLERAYAEKKRKISQQRLMRVLKVAKMAVWEWDENSGEVVMFPPPSKTGGLPVDMELEDGRSRFDFVHPDDVDEHRRILESALREGKNYVSVFRLRDPKHDEWIWVEDTGRGLEDEEGNRRIVGAIRDITELRHTERKLKRITEEAERRRRLHEAIMSSIPDLVFVFGTDHKVLYANDALLKAWGVSWEDAMGRPLAELEVWDSEAVRLHREEIEMVVETKQVVRGELEFEGRTGTRIFDYIKVPVFDDRGDVDAIAGTARDVTGYKEIKRRLEEEAQQKNRFLAVLSHELRNPLAPIKLGLHILERAEPGSQREQKARESIRRQVDQLTRLVDDLLDVTRITKDKIELQRQTLELNELAQDTVSDHRLLFEERGVDLKFEPVKQEVWVEGDPNRLAQVIGNLLQNAAKFTEPGGNTKLWLEPGPKEESVEIHVEDDGMGMDRDTLATLFEAFVQSEGARMQPGAGLGLGLALVKGLVELHGGTVEAHSEGRGKGAEFVVRLPAQFRSRRERAPQVEETEKSGRLQILVIEDNPDVAASMKMVLEMQGHEVMVEGDGISGLERARSVRPDVVICDLGLPGIDGFEVARRLSEEEMAASMKLIALSGYAQAEDVDRSRSVGFEHHLAKPPDLDQLNEILGGIAES